MYLASSSTHADHEAWLIDSGASFHMTLHREWFCEYEKYDGGNVFLGNDSTTRIIVKRRVNLRLIDGRIRTLPGVLHIPSFFLGGLFLCRRRFFRSLLFLNFGSTLLLVLPLFSTSPAYLHKIFERFIYTLRLRSTI